MHDLWQTPVPASNHAASPTTEFPLRLTPPSSGLTFRIMKVPPRSVLDSLTQEDVAKMLREVGANDSGVPSEHILMHRTRTLDLLVVLSGRVTLHLEGGDLSLKPLDCIVQRGTAHAWSTPDDTAASVAVVLIDAPS
ncbi:MAG: cupin domain-containing protein [Proteobacteria bacterium]|nr:cupin domain-containing protein [Pseudomonadota bacterium]